jgi:hypothetical protein
MSRQALVQARPAKGSFTGEEITGNAVTSRFAARDLGRAPMPPFYF